MIAKFYSYNIQGIILAGVGSALTTGAGALTYSMVLSSTSTYGIILLLPVIAAGAGATIFLAVGTLYSVFIIQSKTKLLDSLIYYRQNGVLKQNDRKWIRSYMPRQ